MGFLKKLLNPKNHLKVLKGSTHALASGNIKAGLDAYGLMSGKYDNKSFMNESIGRSLFGSKKPEPTLQEEIDPVLDPAQYAGDMDDPAYGSFADPFDVEDFYAQQDPGYAFELQQGTQALLNNMSAGSGSRSGAALKDLLKYSQGFARTGYNDAFNRHQVQQGNIFSRLSDIAHLGQNAAAGVGNQGTSLAGNAGQLTSNAGSAYGAGIVGVGNAASSGLTNYWLMKQFGGGQPNAVGGGV